MKNKRNYSFNNSRLDIWNNRTIIILLTIGLLFFLCSTHFFHKIVKQQVISQQMAMLGMVYQKDAQTCNQILTYMFESESFEQEMKIGTKALLEFGYTQKGLEYLYQQKGLSDLHFYVLMVQAVIGFFLLILLCYFQKKRYKQEELLISHIQENKQKQFEDKVIYVKKNLFF